MSESAKTTTRGGALKRLALFAGGAIGVGVAGTKALSGENAAAPAAVPAAVPAAATDGRKSRTAVLHGRDWRLTKPLSEKGTVPELKERLIPTGRIVDTKGADLGKFRASWLPDGALQLHTFDLFDGTLLGIGPAGAHDSPFAIVGGTGRYAGATGTYVAKQSPRELGGDGTAEFTLTLTA
jgi:hypothetical protein